ncbi:hypothetical protein 010DV004_71 [Bacillus phage 010DV004]|nr:hypothetical protein 010DV004_71 [Bacillus phage 010DV004]QZA69288.1 hypothetical protein 010DV005_71 [Bacillus phage 010DV005]QZA69572.1 hypothetical protein 035JT004_73 [Bacillus phage 035JT004]QZA69856.1 hypothetical protein 043JT007_70 [Bacillus phage 043JT007]
MGNTKVKDVIAELEEQIKYTEKGDGYQEQLSEAIQVLKQYEEEKD